MLSRGTHSLLTERRLGPGACGAAVLGQRRSELPARGDAEFGEHVARVPLDGARADEQLRADLRVRQALAGLALIMALTAALPARTLTLEVAPVRVNLIAAGLADTPLPASLPGDRIDERREQLGATLPIGRVLSRADIATLALHLMTNTAITGATFDIDGGQQLI